MKPLGKRDLQLFQELSFRVSVSKRPSILWIRHNQISERELWAQISEILGPGEMRKNGRLWRKRVSQGADERLALRQMIEDFDLPRWFSYEYQRNMIRIRYRSH